MKYGNAPKGYDLMSKKDPWWQKHYFPLIPMFETSKGNDYNAASFTFSWLFVRAWSLEHLGLEFAIEVDSTGLNVKMILPYLRLVFRIIPFPPSMDNIIYKMRRK